ncbi:interleukin-17 receptor B isoform X2 [Microcaecilia unicolor]|uniref:Interleukin-17 receptor B isoform X2 n=1 Tax=Microcaecilia unicolor TaxID=1415580 RepID=A0A6P7YGE6_9AMPH|nr:interleukin-17 receptor B isoform X2 [Microcaecilia unicolor]
MTVCWIQWRQSWVMTDEATTGTGSEPEQEQSINCSFHNALQPAPEWWDRRNLTPSDLHSLKASLVVTESKLQSKAFLLNVSWHLSRDGSIIKLTAIMICTYTTGNVRACVRCNYTKPFQRQVSPNGQPWEFHYLGFPVEPDTEYNIIAYNIPIANIGEDAPRSSYSISIPGCNNNTMKYAESCIAKGSLWIPNITACQIKDAMEVNFTVSSLAAKYHIELFSCAGSFMPDCDWIGSSDSYGGNNTRVSVRVPMDDNIYSVTVQVTSSFPACGNDCPGYYITAANCFQGQDPVLGRPPYFIILTSLSLVIFVVVAAIYFVWKHGKVMRTPFIYSAELQPVMKVLLIHLKETTYFQSTVLSFAEFLKDYCRANVILDLWEQERIAEMGPVQWFVAQKDMADKIIFLISSTRNKWVDPVAETTVCHKDENFMFNLALNIFCCDLKSQSSLHKYMVVYFDEFNHKDDLLNILDTCSHYYFMKDIDLFCKDLLNLPRAPIYHLNKKFIKSCKLNMKCIYKLQNTVLEQKAYQAMSTS